MSSFGCRPSSPGRLIGILAAAALLCDPLGRACAAPVEPAERAVADQAAERAAERTQDERVELFLALLKRRARQILEARRPPPRPLVSVSSGISGGYESNVNLDGTRQGDFFTQETLGVVVRPRITPWLRGEFTYDLFNTHYAELRDANLWSNTLEGTIQIQPHDRVRVDLGYEYSIVNFPFNTASSYFNKRTTVTVSLAQTEWLTHRTKWAYQLRDYDTRKARNPSGVGILGVDREDQRHLISHELRLRFRKTFARIGGTFYRNFSNELFQNFYDWDDYRIRGVVSRIFTPEWIGVWISSWERRNYQARNVPAIAVAERDDLYTLAGLLLYEVGPGTQLTYALTYRYQDSNDPRLDFTDWINRFGVTVRF